MPTFSIGVNAKVLGTYVVKKGIISIGRSRTNTISIASKSVSRNHMRIELTPDGWAIADLGSLNGTYVNDIRITNAFISEGDKITIGAYTISFSPMPLQDTTQEEQLPPVQSEVVEASDTDVQFEYMPLTQIISQSPPKENQPQAPAGSLPGGELGREPQHPEIVEQIVQSEPKQNEPNAETRNFKYAGNQALESDEAQRKKNNRLTLLKSNPAGLPLEDKILLVVFENPLVDDTDIRKRLADSDFGGVTIGRAELQSILKKLSLETKVKRYNYFMHS
jgi:pSer/pThr/pTyr-binding forkhead associated (FHA) protein